MTSFFVNSSAKDIKELDPVEVRAWFKDPKIKRALEPFGVQITVFELHAPAKGAKKFQGLGVTLCGRRRAMRNKYVTCLKCLHKINK